MNGQAELAITVDGVAYHLEIELNRLHHPRYVRNFDFKEHSHPAYHFIYTDLADCKLILPEHPPLLCPMQSLLLINPDITHRFLFDAAETEHNSFIWVFRNRRYGELVKPLQCFDGRSDETARPYILKQLTPVQARDYQQVHREAEKALQSGSTFVRSLKYFRLWILGMELLFGDEWRNSLLSSDGTAFLVERIYQLIEINFCYPTFDISCLARELGKNPNYLNTVFARREGFGIGEALRNRRLAYAKTLLAGTNDRIKEIYEQCGYTRQNYFAQAFRRHTGMTPLEYRRETGKRS